MIKAIVSSKTLFEFLNSLDGDQPLQIRFINDSLRLLTTGVVRQMPVEFEGGTNWFNCHNVRWDWLKETCKNLSERPVVLELNQMSVKLILEF